MSAETNGNTAPQRPAKWLVITSVAMVAAPAFQAHIPPLLDYPNHLARMWLVAGGANIPPTSQIYHVDWSSAGTNIGLDLLAFIFGRVMPITTFGSILLALALVLPPVGAVILNRMVFGGFHWWQIAFALLAFGQTMLAGFLNFQLGLGLALLATAADHHFQQKGRLIAALGRAGFAVVLLATHILGLFFYAVLLGGLAVGPVIRKSMLRHQVMRAFREATLSVLPLCLVVLIFVLVAPKLPGAHASLGEVSVWWEDASLLRRLSHFASPITSYNWKVDAIFAIALILPAVLALAQHHFHAGLLLVSALLAGCGIFAPEMVAGTHWIDRRLPIMAALTFASALRPELSRRNAYAATAVMIALVLARTGWVGWIWAKRQADVAAVTTALTRVSEGSAILLMEHRPSPADRALAPLGRYTVFPLVSAEYSMLPPSQRAEILSSWSPPLTAETALATKLSVAR